MKRANYGRTIMKGVKGWEGETIEEKVRRIVHNNEGVSDSAPIIYTERKHGVESAYDIRSDKFGEAIDAMEMMTAKQRKNRTDRQASLDKHKIPEIKKEGGGETPANT